MAQTAPPVVIAPGGPAGATSPPLDYTLRPPPKPSLSERLLQVQSDPVFLGNPFGVAQGFGKFRGSELPRLVAASPRARTLALEANDKFGTASGLFVGALIADVGALGTAIGSIVAQSQATNQNQLTTTTGVLLGVTLGLLLVGVGLSAAGGAIERDAVNQWLEAVNTYNRELVGGQLDASPPLGRM
jgi:hypothetical protein